MKKLNKKQLEEKELKTKDKEWREKIKSKFKFCCAICGRKEFLDCHHIIPRENKELRVGYLGVI